MRTLQRPRALHTPMPASIRQNVAVRLHKSHPTLTHRQIEAAIDQMLDWLTNPSTTDGAPPSQLVDDAWHEFILHTRDYAMWCQENFGYFVHHVPTLGHECLDELCFPCSEKRPKAKADPCSPGNCGSGDPCGMVTMRKCDAGCKPSSPLTSLLAALALNKCKFDPDPYPPAPPEPGPVPPPDDQWGAFKINCKESPCQYDPTPSCDGLFPGRR